MEGLTRYDEYPHEMLVYLRNFGPHFNRKLMEFAISKMEVKGSNGQKTKLNAFSREDVDNILRGHNVRVEHNQLYDYVYVANMCKADFLRSSIVDDMHLALYVKDVIDDVDAPEGLLFNRWYADMSYMGIAIDWEDML